MACVDSVQAVRRVDGRPGVGAAPRRAGRPAERRAGARDPRRPPVRRRLRTAHARLGRRALYVAAAAVDRK